MNLAGKIFVVLNLMLSISFAVASLSLYSKKVDLVKEGNSWVAKHNQLKKELNARNDAFAKLEDEYGDHKRDTQTRINDLSEDLSKESNDRQTAERRVDELTTNVSRIDTEIGNLRAELSKAMDENRGLNEQLKKVEEQLLVAVNDRDFAQKTALEATADLKETEAELLACNRRNAGLMEKVIEQRAIIDRVRQRAPEILRASAGAPVRLVSGKVLKVEEPVDLVIVNLGENDNLKVGMELVISRGSDFVGKVKIRNLYENMASAIIDREMTVKPIRVGDTAETL